MSDDDAQVIADGFGIGEVDVDDTHDVTWSSNLVGYAVHGGLYDATGGDPLSRRQHRLTWADDSVAAVSERRTVVRAHRASHEDPVAMRAGDLLTVGRRDTTWPDCVWSAGPDGREGWVPEAFLEPAGEGTARALRDYDARELDVAPGDVVLAGEEAGGWYWCEAADGRRGWVPRECLAE